MEADDDMIVIIVGNGENEEFPELVKQEVLDIDDVEKIIETAATHGELLDVSIKQEPEENDDTAEEWGHDDDEEYVPEHDLDEDDCYKSYDEVEGSENETNNRNRHQLLKLQKSFVKELRDQYPELENDSNALVTTLSEIMRNVKPPPPPRDFFIMNGIMFECATCGTILESQPAAGRHYQEKHGERYLICFACGVDFRSTTNLYKHEKRCTARDAVVVLKARARVLGRKGRSRPYIPKHFPEPDLKKRSERKFPCSMCPAAFVSKTYLRSHEMLHRGVRPYMCSICPSTYTSLAALSRHHKKHSDVQYICDHCGRAFKIKAALVTHMDTHLAVKKYGCDQCEKRYATKAALDRHVKTRHLNLPPPCVCKICNKRYPLMSVLREHTKRAHGLLLMTRRMFFKSLPTLTETQIEQAKVVLKSELESDYTLQPLPNTLPRPDMADRTRSKLPVESLTQLYEESPVQSTEESLNGLSGESPDHTKTIIFKMEPDQLLCESPNELSEELPNHTETIILKMEPDCEDNSTEQKIVLSEDILQFVQSLQGSGDGESYKLVMLEDSDGLNLGFTELK